MEGNTISTDDYYEAQARMDGAFCDFTEKEKMDYLKKCHDEFGVRNFEMEATMMMAFCKRANISCAGNVSFFELKRIFLLNITF